MLRSPRDTVQSLRLMLDQLQQSPEADGDAESKAELKRILLTRIAELEAEQAAAASIEGPGSDAGQLDMEAAAHQALEQAVAVQAAGTAEAANHAALPVDVSIPAAASDISEATPAEPQAPNLKDMN